MGDPHIRFGLRISSTSVWNRAPKPLLTSPGDNRDRFRDWIDILMPGEYPSGYAGGFRLSELVSLLLYMITEAVETRHLTEKRAEANA